MQASASATRFDFEQNAYLAMSQPFSNFSAECNVEHALREIDRFNVAASAMTRIDAHGSERCWPAETRWAVILR